MTHRTYVFTNMYLEGIRAGVQGAHAVARLVSDYPDTASTIFDIDETMIFLQGGESNDLLDLCLQLRTRGIPFREFHEPGLGDACTAVAAFLPMRIFDDLPLTEDGGGMDPLGARIKSMRLTS